METGNQEVRSVKVRREAGLQIVIEKEAGDEGLCRRTIRATTTDDAMDGIALLIADFANTVGVSAAEVVARLAVKLLKENEGQ